MPLYSGRVTQPKRRIGKIEMLDNTSTFGPLHKVIRLLLKHEKLAFRKGWRKWKNKKNSLK
jgi:hypothetical protein